MNNNRAFLADCERIHREWHERAKARDTNGEYPRAAPDGDQADLVEVMELADGLIQYHRIYWGWFGTALLTRSAIDKAKKAA